MTDAFENAYAYLIISEGGYNNGTYDKGGKTKYGLSQRWLNEHADDYVYLMLEQPPGTHFDEKEIRAITSEQAKHVYYNYFWLPHKFNEINDARIGIKAFDYTVNRGPLNGNKALQRACNKYFTVKQISEDGIVGPKTLSAVNAVPLSDIHLFLYLMCCEQLTDYSEIVINNPVPENLNNFAGWKARALRIPH